MKGIVGIERALRPLLSACRLMVIGAHPDDEPSGILAYLAYKPGICPHIVIVTRGESGQNHIGSERNTALAVLRSQEMKKAASHLLASCSLLANLDNRMQDFGYVKTAAQTLDYWGKDEALEHIVREIRMFRPHILLSCFLDVPTEHGHHQAINQLTLEAAKEANDPQCFPEHFAKGLQTWKPAKVYAPCPRKQATLRIPVGEWDSYLGASYLQLGEASRRCHVSQAMGKKIPPGPKDNYLIRLDDFTAEQSILDGLEGQLAPWTKLTKQVEELFAARSNLAMMLQRTHQLLQQVRQLRVDSSDEEKHILELKEKQLQELSKAICHVDVEVDGPQLIQPGTEGQLTIRVHSGNSALTDLQINIQCGSFSQAYSLHRLAANDPWQQPVTISYPEDLPYTKPFTKSPVRGSLTYSVDGTPITLEIDIPVIVCPPAVVNFQQQLLVVNTNNPQPLTINTTVRNVSGQEQEVIPDYLLPTGWDFRNRERVIVPPESELDISFQIKPPPDIQLGISQVRLELNGKTAISLKSLDYDHIEPSYLLEEASLKISAINIHIPTPLRIGYVETGSDEVASAMRLCGLSVTSLTDQDLQIADLTSYDVIILGVMAYRLRPKLKQIASRLNGYMESGGHLVVQYHRPWDNWDQDSAPYPITLGQPSKEWRVTDPSAKVTPLQEHQFFTYPHVLTTQDWQGWCRERGLYFPQKWSEKYLALVSMADPNEEPFQGGVLTAAVGAGKFTYTSLVWHYQLEAGVTGGYRGFINLIWPTKSS